MTTLLESLGAVLDANHAAYQAAVAEGRKALWAEVRAGVQGVRWAEHHPFCGTRVQGSRRLAGCDCGKPAWDAALDAVLALPVLGTV